jgi:hypothetical protein
MTGTFGLLLSGEANKTSIINAIVNRYNKVLINVPMSIIKTKEDLINIIYTIYYGKDVVEYENRIYLFEDIDCNNLEDIAKKNTDNTTKSNTNSENNLSSDNNKLPTSIDDKKPIYNDMDNLNIESVLKIICSLDDFRGRMIIITTNHSNAFDADLLSSLKIDMNIHIT